MNYQDRISKIDLKTLLPKSIGIFIVLILILFVVGLFPGSWTVVLATLAVSGLVIYQVVLILQDDPQVDHPK